MKPFVRLAALLLAAALLTPLARAELAARDDRGVTVRLARPPQRIVTMMPSLTETVCALQACDRLVGTDRYSDWPERVRALPKAGGLDDANVERIVSLKPDLVLVSGSSRVPARLDTLGIPVAAFEARSHADLQRVVQAVAALIGQPGADALVARIEADTQAAAARVPAALKGKRVYFEVDAGPYAAGPASFIGETLQRLGLGNIVSAELGPFPKLNPEFVVRAQPDLVIAAQRHLADMPQRPGWAALPALQQRRTCGFEPAQYEMLVRPGPRLGEAARLLADCLSKLPS